MPWSSMIPLPVQVIKGCNNIGKRIMLAMFQKERYLLEIILEGSEKRMEIHVIIFVSVVVVLAYLMLHSDEYRFETFGTFVTAGNVQVPVYYLSSK